MPEDAIEVKLNYISKQVDHLLQLSEVRDALIGEMCNRLTILEERQGTMTRLMIAASAAIPTAIVGVAKLMGVV